MIISDSLRLVFVHIPKTAGDSITAALWPFADQEISKRAGPLKHSFARQIRSRHFTPSSWAMYRSFAVVRNSWERIHSSFYYIMHTGDRFLDIGIDNLPPRQGDWWQTVVSVRSLWPDTPRFRDWSDEERRLAFRRWLPMKLPGLKSQLSYLTDKHGRWIVEDIWRYDQLKENWISLRADCGLTGEEARLPHKNKLGERPHYSQDYDVTLANLVATKCEREIAAFGFEFEDFQASPRSADSPAVGESLSI